LKPAQILALVDNHRAAIAIPALSLDACPISKNRLFAQASIFFRQISTPQSHLQP
jgi:hypothetical protein